MNSAAFSGELSALCAEKGYTFDPEAFVAFYESKGWMVGKNKMKSWQSCCVTWQKREGEKSPAKNDGYRTPGHHHPTSNYSDF